MEKRGGVVRHSFRSALEICRMAKRFGLVDHPIEHRSHALPGGVELRKVIRGQVIAVQGVVQPGLGFHCFAQCFVDFVRERRRIPSSGPRFGNHGIDGSRRSPNLVGKGKFFFLWKRSSRDKYDSRLFTRKPIDIEITKTANQGHLCLTNFEPFRGTFHPPSSILHPPSSILHPPSSILTPPPPRASYQARPARLPADWRPTGLRGTAPARASDRIPPCGAD